MVYAIRGERPDDVEAVRNVNLVAFGDNPHSRRTEHLIVDALRASGALAVSLVAIENERVVGHIAFSPARIDGSGPGWFLVGPVAVLPEAQHRGIGSSLVAAGLEALRVLEARGCVLVGEPGFYGRLGFRTSPALSYEGVPDEFVLCLPLSGEEPEGEIFADPAFAIEPEPATSDASLEVPLNVSDSFQVFLTQTPAHAEAWMAAVRGMDEASALDDKTGELAYIAVLAALRLNSGIPFHVASVKKLGATREEVASAILVGLPAAGNAVTQALPVALDAWDQAER